MSAPRSSPTGTAAAISRPGWRCRSGSASSGACSRLCRRRPSSAATARRSRPKERVCGVPPRVYDRCVLRRLRIENLVLIREAELELAPGLNAITGETGAGKTILAQALGLLLGAKGDDSYVGAAAEEAYVEAELDLPDELEELGELRPHACVRVGTGCGARGRRRGRGARRGHVGPIRATAARAAVVPARGPRP